MDGLDLANQGTLLRPGLKVILTSGFPGVRRCLNDRRIEDCPFPMLHKPYRHKELARMLRAILDSDAVQTASHKGLNSEPVLAA
jgi:DNA-binding NtrC family response regulator